MVDQTDVSEDPAGEEKFSRPRRDPEPGSGRLRIDAATIADRLWRTVSATVRTVGSGEERLREVVRAILGEEAFRAVIQSVIPKDALQYLLHTTDAFKDELVALAGRQIQDFLQRLDLGYEIQRVLTTLSLELRAEVRFIPNDRSVIRPDISAGVTVHRAPPKSGAKKTKKAKTSRSKASSSTKKHATKARSPGRKKRAPARVNPPDSAKSTT